mmetsp:Transcript_1588/g.4127  ORF Transcript_1588/g.4127 Transcript_1588/m.4127 type:complete len:883 (-) Transcript_1588:162-2810(-)
MISPLDDGHSSECVRTLKGHAFLVSACSFSPDGHLVLSASWDKTLKVWNAETGEWVCDFTGHTDWVRTCGFSRDGERIVSGSRDGVVKVWDINNGKCISTLEGHASNVTTCRFLPDSWRVVSGSDDGTIKVWDTDSGACIRTLTGHTDWVTACGVSSDGLRIVSGSRNNAIKLWDVDGGDCIRDLRGHANQITACEFSSEGRRVVSSSGDTTIKLWDADSGKCLRTFKGHTAWVNACGFSPDRGWVVSGSGDDTVKLWDTFTGECLETLRGHSNSVTACAFSCSGRRVVTSSGDTTIKLWDLPRKLWPVEERMTFSMIRKRHGRLLDSSPTLDHAIVTLEALVGTEAAKAEAAVLINVMLNGKLYDPYPNLVLEGPPGVGKSIVARALAEVIAEAGMTQWAEIVNVHKHDLCGGTVEETTTKCQAFLEQHGGKILLVDEAHVFDAGGDDRHCAIAAAKELGNFLEREKQKTFGFKTVFIVAGYFGLEHSFFASDRALLSRFPRKLQLEPLSPMELAAVFRLQGKRMRGWRVLGVASPQPARRQVIDGGGQGGAMAVSDTLEQFFQEHHAKFADGNGRSCERLLVAAIEVHGFQADSRPGFLSMADLHQAVRVCFDDERPAARGVLSGGDMPGHHGYGGSQARKDGMAQRAQSAAQARAAAAPAPESAVARHQQARHPQIRHLHNDEQKQSTEVEARMARVERQNVMLTRMVGIVIIAPIIAGLLLFVATAALANPVNGLRGLVTAVTVLVAAAWLFAWSWMWIIYMMLQWAWERLHSVLSWSLLVYLIVLETLYLYCAAHGLVLYFKVGVDLLTVYCLRSVFTAEMWESIAELLRDDDIRDEGIRECVEALDWLSGSLGIRQPIRSTVRMRDEVATAALVRQ